MCYDSRMDAEKTMAFILSQQAGFAARQAVFDERLARLTAAQDSQQKSIFDLIQVVRTMAERQDKQAELLDKKFAETDQKINQLTENMSELRENMNALIKVVDGIVRRDNGRPSA